MSRLTKTVAVLFSVILSVTTLGAESLRVVTFDVDASPPIGSPLAYDPTVAIETPLSCRGMVLTGAGKPIVLCAVDWIGIGNEGQAVFRTALAEAAGTTPERVVVHALHQHDAPRCDFSADELLNHYGARGAGFDPVHARGVVSDTARAIRVSIEKATPVTHIGAGAGVVEKVASNRRILGDDGKVQHTRWTATKDARIRAFPAGTIDPQLKMISFWNGDRMIVALTYYATHPQSYYRTGRANPDFPGLARNERQSETGIPHIHFNGAGGNIGAGKWNDGSTANRQVLADRVAAGMKAALDNTKKTRIGADDVQWSVHPVQLPVAEHLNEAQLLTLVKDESADLSSRYHAATDLAWLRRSQRGESIDISCLSLANARVLHMPGELFVEYQLAAQRHRPDLFVSMAAYGDYAPGYIGTEVAYSEGGYETSPRASKVAPAVEGVLMDAMRTLLGDP